MGTFRSAGAMGLVLSLIIGGPAVAFNDAVLAVVDNEVITVRDLQHYLRGMQAQMRIEGKSRAEAEEIMRAYETRGISQLIEDRLVLAAADRAGVQIRPEVVDQRLAEIRKRYPSSDAFVQVVTAEGLTVTDVRHKLEAQLKGQVMVDREVRSKIYIHPGEVTARYQQAADRYRTPERVYIDTIYMSGSPADPRLKARAEEALQAVHGGLSFEEAVKKYSESPSAGEIALNSLRPELKERLDRMAFGEVSGVIEVPTGVYIIKFRGRIPASEVSLTDARDAIAQELFEEKFRERFQAWTAELRKKSYVEIKD